jgi:hypothetical protein
MGEQSPSLVTNWRASQRVLPHRLNEGLNILTHEVELVTLGTLGRMYRDFRGR